MSEENKALVRRFWDEVRNQFRLSVLEEIVAPLFIRYDPATPGGIGLESLKRSINVEHASYSRLEFTIHEQVAESDKVVTRWTFHAARKRRLISFWPVGRQISISGTTTDRIENGRIVERWENWDRSDKERKTRRRELRETTGTLLSRVRKARKLALRGIQYATSALVDIGDLSAGIRKLITSPEAKELLPEAVRGNLEQAAVYLDTAEGSTEYLADAFGKTEDLLSSTHASLGGALSLATQIKTTAGIAAAASVAALYAGYVISPNQLPVTVLGVNSAQCIEYQSVQVEGEIRAVSLEFTTGMSQDNYERFKEALDGSDEEPVSLIADCEKLSQNP